MLSTLAAATRADNHNQLSGADKFDVAPDLSQTFRRELSPAIWSACLIASVTIVSVGFSAPLVVNWLPSEMNKFLRSWLCPHLLQTPSRGLALIRHVPML